MYKIVVLTKRKPGTTKEHYKNYYETKHAKFGDEYLPPHCIKYIRRYLTPLASPMKAGQGTAPDYDAIVELWFENEEGYKAFEANVKANADHAAIVQDERISRIV